MTEESQWFGEAPVYGFQQRYCVRSCLHSEVTPFQTLAVLDTIPFGRMLILDGAVQVTERDEFLYHEMLVHVPMLSHPNPERILIIGGGDGGCLKQLLQHPVIEVIQAEIDQRVVEISKALLPSVAANAFEDPRVSIVFNDGSSFMMKHKNTFDIILVDSTDPIGPAEVLFSPAFYIGAFAALRDDGILVTQSGSPVLQVKEFVKTFHSVRRSFPVTRQYLAPIFSYPGTLWSFTLGSKKYDPLQLKITTLKRRIMDRRIRTHHYSSDVHTASFSLPPFIQHLLEDEARDLSAFPISISG